MRACQIWAPKSWGLRIPFAQPLTGGTPDHRKGLIRSPLSPQLPGPGSPRAPKGTAWGPHESRIPSLTRSPHCRGHCPDATLFLRYPLQPFPTQLCRTAPQTDAKCKTHTLHRCKRRFGLLLSRSAPPGKTSREPSAEVCRPNGVPIVEHGVGGRMPAGGPGTPQHPRVPTLSPVLAPLPRDRGSSLSSPDSLTSPIASFFTEELLPRGSGSGSLLPHPGEEQARRRKWPG